MYTDSLTFSLLFSVFTISLTSDLSFTVAISLFHCPARSCGLGATVSTDYYYQIGNFNAIGRKRGAESIVLPSMRRSQVPQGVSSNR